MSLNSILNTAYTGLATSEAVLRSISNNVANVNTQGYGREQVQLEALAGTNGGNAGVQVAQIRRVADRFLEQAAYTASSAASRDSVLNDYHTRLQSLIGSPDSGTSLPARTDALFAGLSQLTGAATDIARRRQTVNDVQQLLNGVQTIADNIQSLRADASTQIEQTVTSANAALKTIADLNQQILQRQTLGQSPTALYEQRAQALNSLSQLIDINTTQQADGSVQVQTTSGLTLLDRSVRELQYASPGTVQPATTFPAIKVLIVNNATGARTDSGFTLDANAAGGQIKGLLNLRDGDFKQISDELGQFTATLVSNINAIHNQSSAVPPPNQLIGTNTGLLASDVAQFSGKTTIGVVAADGTLANKVTLDFSTFPANATINDVLTVINSTLGASATASFAGGKLSITASDPTQGIAIGDDSTSPSSRFGRGFSDVFGLNNLISTVQTPNRVSGLGPTQAHGFAAGGSFSVLVRDQNNQTISQQNIGITGTTFGDIETQLADPTGLGRYFSFNFNADGRIDVTAKPGYTGAQFIVQSDNTVRGDTGFSFTRLFGLGDGVQATAATGNTVRADIAADPSKLGLAQFSPTTIIGETALGANDDRGAQALRDLGDLQISFDKAGTLAAKTATASRYLGSVLSDAASRASQASTAEQDSAAQKTASAKQLQDFQGVNLDEELANLVVYQNSYTAAARLVTTTRDLYDTLLGLVR